MSKLTDSEIDAALSGWMELNVRLRAIRDEEQLSQLIDAARCRPTSSTTYVKRIHSRLCRVRLQREWEELKRETR